MANPPRIKVSFGPGIRADRLVRAEMRTGVGNHELAILDFRRRSGDVAPPDGARVTVTWGASAKWSKTFYGYVNHSERVDTGTVTASNEYRLFCVGTSKPLNATNPDRWTQVTDSFIARSIAQRYHLRAVLSKGSSRLNWVQSSSENDFTTLNRLATQGGRCFWVSGATLNFVDPVHRIVTAASGAVQTFTRTNPTGTNPRDTINSLHLVRGADAPGSGAQVTHAFGLDPATGGLLKASSARAYTDAGLVVPSSTGIHQGAVHSAAEGKFVTTSRVFTANWSTLTADVWITDIPVNVGDVVNIAGNGVGATERGRWFVSGTLEVLTYRNDTFGYDYSANLTMTRNQSGTNVMTATKNLTGTSPVVPAVWIANKWQAKSLGATYV